MVALGEAEPCSDLEAMRREDSSWHPCQVSLSSTGVGLTICFENDELEDMEVNTKEALACLRFRSAPLEGDDCSGMKQGDHVLAADKSKSKSLFYDAEVEEVVRVKHSKRVFCRCTFSIKWLHRDLNSENLTVPSSSIMKLASKSISLHPIVDKFLKMVANIDSPSSSSPFSPVLEDLNGEIDLNKLIDQQIEQITNAVDASEGIARDILLGVKGDIEGEIRSKRNSSHAKSRDDQNIFKRSTRSSKKSVKDEKVEAAPAPAPSTEEKHESISQLSPLAARALLASITAMNGSRLSDFLTDDNLYMKNKPKPSSESLTCSKVEKKSGQTVQTRVTRSTVKTGDGTPTSTARQKTGSTNEKRLTRSAIREEKEVGVGLEENPSNSKGSVSRKKTNIPFEQQDRRQVSGTVETSRETEAVTLTAAAKSGRLTRSAIREGKESLTIEETPDAVEPPQEAKGDGTSGGGRKRKSSSVSSHKQERRFSPRNHSQEKATTK